MNFHEALKIMKDGVSVVYTYANGQVEVYRKNNNGEIEVFERGYCADDERWIPAKLTIHMMSDDNWNSLPKSTDDESMGEAGIFKGAFINDLKILINRYSIENDSDTPDYILAKYIANCLYSFRIATKDRDAWHGNKSMDEKLGLDKPLENIKKETT
jgi:hypothetical protein